MVIRTDAAWHEGLQLAGLGWTIGDIEGSRTFTEPALNVGSPLMAEGLAVREAIMKCRNLGLSRIRCESDSELLIRVLNSETTNAELYGVSTDILELAFSFECISFNWIPRERNYVADGLAKQCLAVEQAIMVAPNSG